MNRDLVKISRALVSVWDKRGLEHLADTFRTYDVEVISTGNTARRLRELGVKVSDVSQITSSPEILSGRVKTLHPIIHAGLLARRDNTNDAEDLQRVGANTIDLVVVNLYPFRKAFKVGEKDLVEFIDIGGPTMLRAGAKNFRWVTVVSEVSDYQALRRELDRHDGATSLSFRKRMAGKVFRLTARYDLWIAQAMFGDRLSLEEEPALGLEASLDLRYGENPHQSARFYVPFGERPVFEKLQGKELSYNNIMDLSSAWEIVRFFSPQICATVVKHGNPCGLAIGDSPAKAYRRAYAGDPLSSFGGIVGVNTVIDEECAKEIVKSGFRECVIAPKFTKGALEWFRQKKNLRVVRVKRFAPGLHIRPAFNGFLLQERDTLKETIEDLEVVSKRRPTKAQMQDLLFAFWAVRFVHSNAIVVAKRGQVLGVGAGQMSRVDAVRIALEKAGEKAKGAVLASDAFFPKTDNVDLCAEAGIKAIVQPAGSKADPEVIEACNRYGIALVFTRSRHFLH